jgi:hypothetical protein
VWLAEAGWATRQHTAIGAGIASKQTMPAVKSGLPLLCCD